MVTISTAFPARITIMGRSIANRALEFHSLDELAELFEMAARGPRHFKGRSFAPWFRRYGPHALVVLEVAAAPRSTPALARAEMFERSRRLSLHGVPHFAYETPPPDHRRRRPSFVIVSGALARSRGELDAATRELACLAGAKPTALGWARSLEAAVAFPMPAPGLAGGSLGFVGSLRGDWTPAPADAP